MNFESIKAFRDYRLFAVRTGANGDGRGIVTIHRFVPPVHIDGICLPFVSKSGTVETVPEAAYFFGTLSELDNNFRRDIGFPESLLKQFADSHITFVSRKTRWSHYQTRTKLEQYLSNYSQQIVNTLFRIPLSAGGFFSADQKDRFVYVFDEVGPKISDWLKRAKVVDISSRGKLFKFSKSNDLPAELLSSAVNARKLRKFIYKRRKDMSNTAMQNRDA